jgi:hypothetical protein
MQDTNDHDLSLIAQEVNRIISRETDAQARRNILTRGRGVGEMTQRLAIILDFIDQTVRSRFRGFDSNVEPDFGEVSLGRVGQAEGERSANSFLPRAIMRVASKSLTRPAATSASPASMSVFSAASSSI